jgi:hypothetical protein
VVFRREPRDIQNPSERQESSQELTNSTTSNTQSDVNSQPSNLSNGSTDIKNDTPEP